MTTANHSVHRRVMNVAAAAIGSRHPVRLRDQQLHHADLLHAQPARQERQRARDGHRRIDEGAQLQRGAGALEARAAPARTPRTRTATPPPTRASPAPAASASAAPRWRRRTRAAWAPSCRRPACSPTSSIIPCASRSDATHADRHADQPERHPRHALAAAATKNRPDADRAPAEPARPDRSALGHDDRRGARHRHAVHLAQQIRLQHLAHLARRHRQRKTR